MTDASPAADPLTPRPTPLPATPATPVHTPVLLAEVLALLNPQPGETFLDCTLGLGGHALAVAERLGPTGRLWGVDHDPEALRRAEVALRALPAPPELHFLHGSFAKLPELLPTANAPRFDLLLADLGVSSMQFDDPARGFSFRFDAPLDMRMDPSRDIATAYDMINGDSEERLAQIFYEYGEERKSRQIAAAIGRERRRQPIRTTHALA
ncbi:MAG TPA: 16S rRNA (cytosine(1402)-N(4))-methyltransferase RsmH, partial [Planctomycetota bacterium]|nr:16S rRNA (cytosine(1402)-N(4))-methyltransferase RsmH [Planctomycetota bacterium]